jgi:hypothetical protein
MSSSLVALPIWAIFNQGADAHQANSLEFFHCGPILTPRPNWSADILVRSNIRWAERVGIRLTPLAFRGLLRKRMSALRRGGSNELRLSTPALRGPCRRLRVAPESNRRFAAVMQLTFDQWRISQPRPGRHRSVRRFDPLIVRSHSNPNLDFAWTLHFACF